MSSPIPYLPLAVYWPRSPHTPLPDSFKPSQGDVLEVHAIFWIEGGSIANVPFEHAGKLVYGSVPVEDLLTITAHLARDSEKVRAAVCERMRVWLSNWTPVVAGSLYSKTGMALGVAPWLELGEAYELCEEIGWS